MTQSEFEAADQEAMDLANRATVPGAGAMKVKTDALHTSKAPHGECEDPYAKCRRKANRARELLWAALKAVFCVAVTFFLMVVLARPEYLVHLVNLGVVISCVAAGIIVDRAIRG